MQTNLTADHRQPFGIWLRSRRQELGLTQGALAERAGCARDVIRQFESGAKRPSPQLADRLAAALGIEAERAEFVAAARAVGPRALRPARPAPLIQPALPPFAATKLQPPRPRRDLLPRPRLADELRAAIGGTRLVLVSAPPGAGKTTLVAQVLSAPAAPRQPAPAFGWLTLDEDDNDLARFLAALAAAAGAIAPAAEAQARAALAAGLQAAAAPAALGRQVAGTIANALLGALNGPAALVLDDLHAVVDPAALAALDYLIDQLPAPLTLVLTTRHDPPLALARRRARRELVELRMDDLRLTEAEAADLLNTHLGLSLPPAQIAALHAQTEGWVAGVGLLAASLERIAAPADRARFLSSLANVDRYLFDYLAEEVLNRQDPFVRMFLLETAILQDLSPEVCAAVTGREDAGAILDELYRRNLFLVEIGSAPPAEPPGGPASGSVYRYHTIFRDFLRERLRREAPDWLRGLHRRAAKVERHPARQIHHLLAAEDWQAAAARVAAVAEAYAGQGAVGTLRGWINALPEQVSASDPWMLYWQGVCAYRELDLDVAQRLFARALAGFEAAGDAAGEGEALVQSLILAAAWADLPLAEARAERALACPLPDHRRGRLLVARAQGRTTHGRWEQANADLDAAIALAGAPGADPRVAIDVAEGFRGVFSALPGGVDRFERLLRVLRPLAREPDSLPRIDLLELQMYVGLWRGRWDDAIAAAVELYTIGERLGIAGWARITSAWLPALCGAIRGDDGLAERYGRLLLPPAGEDPSALNAGVNALMIAWYGRMQWIAGNPEGLREAEDQLRAIAARSPAEWIKVVHAMLRGILLLGERRFGEAEALLRRAADSQDKAHLTLLSSSARLLLAHLLLATQRPDAALAAMLPQLRLHAAQDTPGFLMWEGRAVAAPLLRLAIERGEEPDFAARTLRLIGDEAAPPAPAAPGSLVVPATGETLTAREVEVLQLIARGASNQAIADRLIISLHTAKRHVANILQKLDATSRTEAAARAHDLGVV